MPFLGSMLNLKQHAMRWSDLLRSDSWTCWRGKGAHWINVGSRDVPVFEEIGLGEDWSGFQDIKFRRIHLDGFCTVFVMLRLWFWQCLIACKCRKAGVMTESMERIWLTNGDVSTFHICNFRIFHDRVFTNLLHYLVSQKFVHQHFRPSLP